MSVMIPCHGAFVDVDGHRAVWCGTCGRWLDLDDDVQPGSALVDHAKRAHRGVA